MTKHESIKELFKKWPVEGKLIPDGFLSDYEDNIEILFVAKESNDKGPENSGFWLKTQVESWNKNDGTIFQCNKDSVWFEGKSKSISKCKDNKDAGKEKRTATKFIKCLIKCYSLYSGEGIINSKVLGKCAYINLNKQGGGSSQSKDFYSIVKSDRKRIIEEIDIINPDKIVFLGEKWAVQIIELLKEGENGFKRLDDILIYGYHPSDRGSIYSGMKLKTINDI